MTGEDLHERPRVRRVGDLAFRVLRAGRAGVGPAFVLVHGIGVSHRYFRRLHERLARTGVCVAVDLPGFGGLPKPRRDLDVPALASALEEVIDSLDLGPVVLVGQSMGAQWVVEIAVRRPDLVDRVVVIGPVADDRHRTAVAQTTALALDALREPPAVAAIVLGDYVRCGVRWYLAQLRSMLEYRIEDRVRLLTVPLLIIRGGRDPIAGMAWCRRLRDAASDAALVVVPGSPHIVHHSSPHAVTSAIAAHGDSTRRKASGS